VCQTTSINSIEELTQSYNLLEDPSINIARFIRGLQTDLKREAPSFAPSTLNEGYHNALEIEKLNNLYPRHPTPSSMPHANLFLR